MQNIINFQLIMSDPFHAVLKVSKVKQEEEQLYRHAMIIVIEPPPLHPEETIIIRVNWDNSKSTFYISLL